LSLGVANYAVAGTQPIPITTLADLQNIAENPAGNYVLMNDIDATAPVAAVRRRSWIVQPRSSGEHRTSENVMRPIKSRSAVTEESVVIGIPESIQAATQGHHVG
jgi:hypothetical protein